jgi:hypothetical protein
MAGKIRIEAENMDSQLGLGQMIKLSGVYCKNPITGKTTSHKQYFIVSDIHEDGTISVNGRAERIPLSEIDPPWGTAKV